VTSRARRRLLLGLALLATLAAAIVSPSEQATTTAPAKRNAKAPAAGPRPQAPRAAAVEAEVPPLAQYERRIDEKFKVVDIFDSRPLAVAGLASAAPPAPVAPKLPFSYMGSIDESGKPKYVLVQGEQLFMVHVGDEFAGSYRLEQVTPLELVVTYLPLDARQSLPIGESK
jgi:hypothetical protein